MNKQSTVSPGQRKWQQLSLFRSTIWPLLVICGQLLSDWRAERHYTHLPEVLPSTGQDLPANTQWPGISIIVPARNEEANLPKLLQSLIAQDYPLYEIIIVDDVSTDATADIVRSFARHDVRLLQSAGPPADWTGKNHACWLGATASKYPWLLFIDADGVLHPQALRSSLAFALEKHTGALSLFAQQECKTFWERLLLPFAYQQYFVGVNPQRVNSECGPALANGQFFLISSDAYQQVGGHAANASSVIDDVALATRLKNVGITPLACRGEALVSVRMYTGLRAIIEGFGKNSYLFLRQSPLSGIQTALSTMLATSVPLLFISAWRKQSVRTLILTLLAYLAQVRYMRSWVRRFSIHPVYALLAPLSALAFIGIPLNSMLRVLTGRSLSWKGRSYKAVREQHVRFSYPLGWILQMGLALLMKTPRSIIEDSAIVARLLATSVCTEGTEHIPVEGSFVLVSNHHQSLSWWIGLSEALMIDAIAKRRPDITMHFVTTDRARIGRFTLPGTQWLIERVAAVWDLVLVTPPAVADDHANRQRYVLLHLLRLLKRAAGGSICIGFTPEGDEGTAAGLTEAIPGSGRALYALSTKGLSILPAAVWEEGGHMRVRFGMPFSLTETAPKIAHQVSDDWARSTVMRNIAALLPPMLRGSYGRELDDTLE